MSLETFNPDPLPSPGTSTKPAFALKTADFGDNYQQTTRDGMNWIKRTITLKWDVLTEAQADALEAFFLGKGGDTPFLYTRRGDVARQYTCTDYERIHGSPNTFSATLVEDFRLF
jgi:phage-related protein